MWVKTISLYIIHYKYAAPLFSFLMTSLFVLFFFTLQPFLRRCILQWEWIRKVDDHWWMIFFLGARVHYAGRERKKTTLLIKRVFNQWHTRPRGTVTIFFLCARDIFFYSVLHFFFQNRLYTVHPFIWFYCITSGTCQKHLLIHTGKKNEHYINKHKINTHIHSSIVGIR